MATTFLIFVPLFSLLATTTSTSTIPNDAVTLLSNSGYNSMALTLEFGSRSLITPPSPNSLTIFSPSDTAFSNSGQPSLNLLQFHFSPRSYSLHSLKSLPYGSKVPTLWPNHSLIITYNGEDDKIEVNGVKINGFPLYNDGSLVVFGIDQFLDPNFHFLDCDSNGGDTDSGDHSLKEASEVLRSRKYSIMASFLDLQLGNFKNQTRLTIFAPTDESLMGFLGNNNIKDYKSTFFRHFVSCKVSMIDLINFESAGVLLHTYLNGFLINVTTHGNNMSLNGIEVIAPEIYNNSWVIVHGLSGSFLVEEMHQAPPDSNCANFRLRDLRFIFLFTVLSIFCILFENTELGVIFLILLILVTKHC